MSVSSMELACISEAAKVKLKGSPSSLSVSSANAVDVESQIAKFRRDRAAAKDLLFRRALVFTFSCLLGDVSVCSIMVVAFGLQLIPFGVLVTGTCIVAAVHGCAMTALATTLSHVLDVDAVILNSRRLYATSFVSATIATVIFNIEEWCSTSCCLALAMLVFQGCGFVYDGRSFMLPTTLAIVHSSFMFLNIIESIIKVLWENEYKTIPFSKEWCNILVVLAVILSVGVLIVSLEWLRQRLLFMRTCGLAGLPPTHAWVVWFYHQQVLVGICFFTFAAWETRNRYLFSPQVGTPFFLEVTWSAGFTYIVPPILLSIVGRDVVFNFMARIFERNRAELDGALMAELLTDRTYVLGMKWWIHHGREDKDYTFVDPRRNWTKGHIVEIADDAFFVETEQAMTMRNTIRSKIVASFSSFYMRTPTAQADPSIHRIIHRLAMLDRQTPALEILELARRTMRCIDWETLTYEIMQGPVCGSRPLENMYLMSRPLGPFERIDYFMSHSWHDESSIKWLKLVEVAENFRKRKGRFPTFWLDKVCIDQDNIAEGLKVLPVTVMACSKMLVLCGHTYPERLWCVWELCTLFSFMTDLDQAHERVELVPLTTSSAHSDRDVFAPLRHFDVDLAHCYDPNEEQALMTVINAVGKKRFQGRVRDLAVKMYSPS